MTLPPAGTGDWANQPTPVVWLFAATPEGQWPPVPLPAGPVIVGRDTGCGVVLAEASVSRRHLRLDVLEDGTAVARDLQSSNGVYVDGHRLTEPMVVRPGQPLLLGRVTVVLVLPTG